MLSLYTPTSRGFYKPLNFLNKSLWLRVDSNLHTALVPLIDENISNHANPSWSRLLYLTRTTWLSTVSLPSTLSVQK
jgi:hypothetical protein